jgi:hypothetical protein
MLDGGDRAAPGWGTRRSGLEVRAGHFDDTGAFEGFGAHFFLKPSSPVREIYALHEPGQATRGTLRKRDGNVYTGAFNTKLEPDGRGHMTFRGVRVEGMWKNGKRDKSQASSYTHTSGPIVDVVPGYYVSDLFDRFSGDTLKVRWPDDHAL